MLIHLPGVFYIDLDAGVDKDSLMMFTISHELTHFIKEWSPAKYNEFKRFLLQNYADKDVKLDDLVTRKILESKKAAPDAKQMSYAQALDEVVAESAQRFLLDSDAMNKLAKLSETNKSLAARIVDKVRKLLGKLRAAFRGARPQGEEAKIVETFGEQLDRLEELWAEGLEDAAKNYKAGGKTISEARALEMMQEVEQNGAETQQKKNEYADYDQPITMEDVMTLRDIGRVSVNSFKSADIVKAQKWAYLYYKELKTKSPFFRAWFGDWRAKDTAEKVTVADIPAYVATNEARKANRGTAKNTDTNWEIAISRQGETNTISHSGEKRLSEYGLAGVKSLVENAILLDSEVHQPHKNNAENDNIAFDHKLYALGVNEKGSVGLYRIIVEEYYNDPLHTNNKRFHNLKYIEKVADVPVGAYAAESHKSRSAMGSSTTEYSIAQLYNLVKIYDKDFSVGKEANPFVLNEDGTPKVFYHGTDAEFTVFDRTKGRSTMDIQGMFFSPWEIEAGGYGKNVGTYYLSIQNPASEGTAYKALNMFKGQNDAGVKAREYLEKRGYDGVNVGGEELIAFYPEQIKSASDNIGTFDRSNKDIRFQRKAENDAAVEYEMQTYRDLKEMATGQESVTARERLSSALEDIAVNETEKNVLKRYKSEIAKYEALEQQLRETRREIRKIESEGGTKNNMLLKYLRDEATKLSNNLKTYDSRLLKLENTKPLRDVVSRGFCPD